MKIKQILPLVALSGIATTVLPLVSCGNSNQEEFDPEDGPFVPTIDPLAPSKKTDAELNDTYFGAISKNHKILAEDILWSQYGKQTNENSQKINVEVTKVNKETQTVSLNMQITANVEGHEVSTTSEFNNFRFKVQFVHNIAWVYPDPTQISEDSDWSFKATDTGAEPMVVDKSSDEQTKAIGELACCYLRFKSYYLSKTTNSVEEQPIGKITGTNIPSKEPGPEVTYDVQPIDDIIPGTYYTGKLHIEAKGKCDPNTLSDFAIKVNDKIYDYKSFKWTSFGGSVAYGDETCIIDFAFAILDPTIVITDGVKFVTRIDLAQ